MNTRKSNKQQCLRDIVRLNVPEKCFKLMAAKTDGRKWRQLCRERRDLLHILASYANPDGSSIRPSVEMLKGMLRCGRSTVYRLLADLQTLGFLRDKGIHQETGVRTWSLNMQKIMEAVTKTVPGSGLSETEAGSDDVPDSPKPVPSSRGAVSDSHSPVPVQGESGTQPSERPSSIPTSRPDPASEFLRDGTDSDSNKDIGAGRTPTPTVAAAAAEPTSQQILEKFQTQLRELEDQRERCTTRERADFLDQQIEAKLWAVQHVKKLQQAQEATKRVANLIDAPTAEFVPTTASAQHLMEERND